jgi:1,4-dihydroxy-2-naphthoyl-CoA synthase
MEYSAILFDVQDGVAQITLNRPEVLNSINLDIARDLMYAILRCDEDPAIRAVVINGAGSEGHRYPACNWPDANLWGIQAAIAQWLERDTRDPDGAGKPVHCSYLPNRRCS